MGCRGARQTKRPQRTKKRKEAPKAPLPKACKADPGTTFAPPCASTAFTAGKRSISSGQSLQRGQFIHICARFQLLLRLEYQSRLPPTLPSVAEQRAPLPQVEIKPARTQIHAVHVLVHATR